MKLTFSLREPKKEKPTPIYGWVHWTTDGQHRRFRIITGRSVLPRLWDQRRKRAKKGATGEAATNAMLAKIETNIQTTFSELAALGQPLAIEAVQARYAVLSGKVARKGARDLFADYRAYIDGATSFTEGTKRNHRKCLNHLRKFGDAYNITLSYDRFDVLLWERFVSWLLKVQQHTNPSVWNVCKSIKAFLVDSRSKGFHDNDSHTNVTRSRMLPRTDNPEQVYLTMEELRTVANLDFTEDVRLGRVRDLFIFLCHTGFRFGDSQLLNPEHRRGDVLKFTTGKNRKAITVPLVGDAREIWERYSGNLPRISNQKGNNYLAEVLERAGIDTPCPVVSYRGTERIEETLPKWKLCGWHSSKRTYITLSRQLGVSVEALRRSTGNSLATLETYRLGTDEDSEKELRKAWNPELA
jgi:hypothetical protein